VEIRQLEPTIVTGDMTWLRQLIVILVENACRYTPHGGQVAVALERHSADAVISVTDTGIGIAPEDLPHVFDRFYRADAARSRVVEGSGLGLAIASWIVRAHGGTIGVASQVGAGSQFTVHLPAVIPSSSLEPETKAVAQRGN
jgi:signal transduction histidine kinase